MTRKEFFNALRQGTHTSHGCYPLFFLMADGNELCVSCARHNALTIGRAMPGGRCRDHAWTPVAHGVNWEDAELTCGECQCHIESAYAG